MEEINQINKSILSISDNTKHDTPKLAIIVPCYNEEEVLHDTARQLSEKIHQMTANNLIADSSRIIFVDDGSRDKTWNIIEELCTAHPAVFGGIKLSANRGHQNALVCGLLTAKDFFDATISIDADLQDDINVIDEMVEKYCQGCEIVYGVRSERKTDSAFKRATAQGFYRFMRFLGVNIQYNHADFRLMGSSSLSALAKYNEVNLFLRGIIPLLGYKTDSVYYSRKERTAGVSKYPLRKMLQFALEGITSFSVKPIRFITLLGVLVFGISIGMIFYFLLRHFTGHTVIGWATIACSIWGIGGLILFSIGIVGEYIGKIYLETKARPRYNIEKSFLGDEK